MTNIEQIYDEYTIIPILRMHMYRVAGVASFICKNFQDASDLKEVISACLLHDMGNILKFNFNVLAEAFEPQGKEHWASVQKNFRNTYGEDEHEATYAIARELNVSDRVHELIQSIGFGRVCGVYENGDFAKKTCTYADQRVGPFGVLPLRDRISEGHKRHTYGKKVMNDEKIFQEHVSCFEGIEKQIFEHLRIQPSDIDDTVVNPEVERLKGFTLKTKVI